MAPEVHVDYVRELFGQPAFQIVHEGQRGPRVGEGRSFIPATFVEYVWLLDHDGFFQAVTDQDGTVVRHAITSASRKFRPKIQVAAVSGGEPEFVVRLGATRFGDLPSLDNCDEVYWWLGARRYEYRESYYCGDRGGYVDWVCSFNDAGIGPWLPLHLAVDPPPMLGVREWVYRLDAASRAQFQNVRKGTVINTLAVSTTYDDESGQIGFGPDLDRVRMISPPRGVTLRKTVVRWLLDRVGKRGSRGKAEPSVRQQSPAAPATEPRRAESDHPA